jgi:hypothetical protein
MTSTVHYSSTEKKHGLTVKHRVSNTTQQTNSSLLHDDIQERVNNNTQMTSSRSLPENQEDLRAKSQA